MYPLSYQGVIGSSREGGSSGEGTRDPYGNLKGTLGSTRENSGLVGYLPHLEPLPEGYYN